MKRILRRGAALTGFGISAAGACVAFDDGLRREAQFWRFAAPAVVEYWAVKYTHTETTSEQRYEDLHQKYAPRALETILKLRGLFTKFAQVCSVRPEFVPEAYRVAFKQLQSEVPGEPVELVRAVIEDELGPIDSLFSEFDAEPCGAASIGQVHRAVTVDGEEVAVKVQYPGVRSMFTADLHCISWIVWLARPKSIPSFAEFAKQIETELDFNQERRNLQEIYDDVMPVFADRVQVPEVRTSLCSDKVITMSFVPGKPLQDVASMQLRAVGIEPPSGKDSLKEWIQKKKGTDMLESRMSGTHRLEQFAIRWLGPDVLLWLWRNYEKYLGVIRWSGMRLLEEMDSRLNIVVAPQWIVETKHKIAATTAVQDASRWMETLFEVTGYEMFASTGGLFQADPHPGNVLLMPDGRLGLIDYGQCKRLSPQVRLQLAELVTCIADSASDEEVAQAFRAVGMVTERDDSMFIANFGRLIFGSIQPNALDSSWHRELHRKDSIVTFPADLIMVSRTVGILRGCGLMLKCNIGAADKWRPSASKLCRHTTH